MEPILPRIDLRVPFNQKEDAQRLGARWDPRHKIWYVPAGVDAAPLHQWLPAHWEPNVRASSYFLATTKRDCWRCTTLTRVVALVLPVEHEVFFVGDDPADDCWQVAGEPTVLSYIKHLADSVAARLHREAPYYRVDFSQTTEDFYWMNHCRRCEAKLGDFYTFDTPGRGFAPRTLEEAAAICLEEVPEIFSAWCGRYTCGLEWFSDASHMDVIPPKSAGCHTD